MKEGLLIYGEEEAWTTLSEDEAREVYRQYAEFGEWLREKGWGRGSEELASTSAATSVRRIDGQIETTAA